MLRLTLDALQVLDAIARRGTFAAAADELHRTTSTLSYTVKKLEDDLSVQLFDRSGHRALLTDAGRLLLDEGRMVLDAARAVERRVRSVGDGWEAELMVAVNELVPMERVLEAVADFYAAGHPTRIRIRTEVLAGVWESLVSRRADVAVTEVEAHGSSEIAHRPIGALPFVFAVAPDHPLAREKQPVKLAAIRRHRVVMVADSAYASAPRSSGVPEAADTLTVSSLQTKLTAQVMGLGVGFLPEPMAAGPISKGQLVKLRVAAPKLHVQFSVAWRSSEDGPALRWFIERLRTIDLTSPGHLS